ncbi:PhzF family phenazine biosynthesis protein [Chitinophaga nivalis]|uniref:PhzF family phenazine biosynthesis protein n=1 Tax=Chitinophaga nivalis TaxID=2991709 RepID=A0ABT3IQC6_9BACT|nr:PhzF family phenazine biosynthesis protein [Chitinophaga nivalis]MCW3464131.1 PhzF family phenazine biosynthesis protein [Chitinophaga nivalis]MCW3486179.1 PhzF family phenazine biosynthesis protein [Chitinophaga nivalis]
MDLQQIDIYQVDAFTMNIFGGNPAAVCVLQQWLPTPVLQQIAAENFLPETAFFIPGKTATDFELRWFTPEIEMDLCGHATLATAHVLFHHIGVPGNNITFSSNSGVLPVSKKGAILTLDFPSRPPEPATLPSVFLEGLGVTPTAVFKSRDYVVLYEHESIIRQLQPNPALIHQLNIDPGGIVVTAPGESVDFVSRFFTPQASIFEDPVTGSAHCSLIPFWSKRLNKTTLTAQQLSARIGELYCTDQGDRVLIGGACKTYLVGKIFVPTHHFAG